MDGRLERNTRPVRYDITIDTDFSRFAFTGEESIELETDSNIRSVTLNAAELTILGASIEHDGLSEKARIAHDRKNEKVTFAFTRPFGTGSVLHVRFSGTNGDGLYGMYRSRFGSGKGKRGYVLTTQFEAAHARNVFPCFDEPAFKAVFCISLIVDRDLEAISNMPVRSSKAVNGRKKVSFMPTVRMSSYLVYMGAGRFEAMTGSYKRVKLRALATPGKMAMCSVALGYAKKFLSFYEGYFGIGYPLPKLDLIAVPDLAAAAMENWGAIVFNDREMLIGERSSGRTRVRVADVVAHELAHQWFGNLVTMEWWDDTWLNESFAQFMAYKAIDAVFPSWKRGLEFYDEEMAAALEKDQFRSTHPVFSRIASVEEIDKVFDDISYRKGSSVLRMLEDYMGADEFRRGLHGYLLEHAFSNARKEDLWDSLELVAAKGSGLKAMMNEWLTRPGYPALHVRGNTVEQSRFLMKRGQSAPGRWPIPIKYSVGGDAGSVLMRTRTLSVKAARGGVLKLNRGQRGLYRTFYGKGELRRLLGMASKGAVPDEDCWGLVSDLAALAYSGRMKLQEFLECSRSFRDCGYPASIALLDALGRLSFLFHGTEHEADAVRAVRDYSSLLLGRLGWKAGEDEDPHAKITRRRAIAALGGTGDPETVKRCVSLFRGACAGKPVDNDIRRAAYTVVGRNSPGSFDRIITLYRKTKLSEEKVDLIAAMSEVRDPRLMRRALSFSLSKDVRRQDGWIIPAFMGDNSGAAAVLLKWSMANWRRLMRDYRPGTLLLGTFVQGLSGCRTRNDYDTIKRFFSARANRRSDIEIAISKTLERIAVNIDCLESNGVS